jgi:cytochrome c oxidase assembly protein subunit 15
MQNIWLHRYAVLVAACTLLLVAAGATVTSKEAGLSVPDWPLSYGQVMPPMTGNIFFEHGHRMIASGVGFLTVILAGWIWRRDERPWMKKLGLAALGAVIIQGILGGMTVLFLLPPAVSISHACLAQLFFTSTVAIALFTSPAWKQGAETITDSGGLPLPRLSLLAPSAVLIQLALGAAYRHKVINLMWHVLGAMLVSAVVMFLAMFALLEFRRHQAVRQSAIAMLTITFLQIFLGVAAYMSRVSTLDAPQPMLVMVVFTVLHVAVGALTLASSAMFAIQVRRNIRGATPETAEGSAALAHR